MVDFPPRLAQERARAYEAFTTYAGMGAARSCAKVGQELGKSATLMERWSTQHFWVSRAQSYDRALSLEAAAASQRTYLADIEAHRKRTEQAGKALYAVAAELLKQVQVILKRTPLRIVGQDGKTYDIPTFELKASDLMVCARAFVVAADMEAHALQLDTLMGMLNENTVEKSSFQV